MYFFDASLPHLNVIVYVYCFLTRISVVMAKPIELHAMVQHELVVNSIIATVRITSWCLVHDVENALDLRPMLTFPLGVIMVMMQRY